MAPGHQRRQERFLGTGGLQLDMKTELFERRLCQISGLTIWFLTSFCLELVVTVYSILFCFLHFLVCFYFFVNINLILFYFLTLQYCIAFAIYQNESATGIHVFRILNPSPTSLPIPSLWVVPAHQPQASSIVHRTWTGNSFHI